MKTNLLLDEYLVGDTLVYGLKTSESTINPDPKNAGSVLCPTHTFHTRFTFAKMVQEKIIIQLAKRLSNGYTITGTYGQTALKKINQCSRIMDHYKALYVAQFSKPNN